MTMREKFALPPEATNVVTLACERLAQGRRDLLEAAAALSQHKSVALARPEARGYVLPEPPPPPYDLPRERTDDEFTALAAQAAADIDETERRAATATPELNLWRETLAPTTELYAQIDQALANAQTGDERSLHADTPRPRMQWPALPSLERRQVTVHMDAGASQLGAGLDALYRAASVQGLEAVQVMGRAGPTGDPERDHALAVERVRSAIACLERLRIERRQITWAVDTSGQTTALPDEVMREHCGAAPRGAFVEGVEILFTAVGSLPPRTMKAERTALQPLSNAF